MNTYKKLGYLFTAFAVVLSAIMCFVIACNYRDMLCGIEYRGFSAPAGVSFLSGVPFLTGIIACAVLAIGFHRKSK